MPAPYNPIVVVEVRGAPSAAVQAGQKPRTRLELIDKARAAFVRQYLGLRWPETPLYRAMFNTEMDEPCTAAMLVECLQLSQRDREYSQ
jgi:hypothetical protein